MAEHTDEPTAVAEPEISDLDLRNIIDEALWSLDSIRVSKPALDISVNGGRATVRGIVASPMMREHIEDALAGLPVTLDLLDDAAIQHAAAYALATDSRTQAIPPGYRLASRNGHIHVKGRLSVEQAQATLEVVRQVKGVQGASVN